jgi:hypothetical protein
VNWDLKSKVQLSTVSDSSKFSNVTVLFIPRLSLLCDKDRYIKSLMALPCDDHLR